MALLFSTILLYNNVHMHTPKNFIRHQEDFVCESCGTKVNGNGYTNHCPNCLYSKHVDLKLPGDRLNICHGLMQPIDFEVKNGQYYIFQKCLKCGNTGRIKSSKEDNIDVLIDLSQKKIKS